MRSVDIMMYCEPRINNSICKWLDKTGGWQSLHWAFGEGRCLVGQGGGKPGLWDQMGVEVGFATDKLGKHEQMPQAL